MAVGGSKGAVPRQQGRVLICGGAAVDCIVKPSDASQHGASRTSMPGQAIVSQGGVGRNVAEVVAKLGGAPRLLSAVGEDEAGQQLISASQRMGIEVDCMARIRGGRTATFTALLDGSGDLVGAVADMDVLDKIEPAVIDSASAAFADADLVVCDGNLSAEALQRVLMHCAKASVPVWFEPVSLAKAPRGRCPQPWHLVAPNWDEMLALLGHPPKQLPETMKDGAGLPDFILKTLDEVASSALADNVLLTMGSKGAVLATAAPNASADGVVKGVYEIAMEPLLAGIEGAPAGIPNLTVQVDVLPAVQGRRLWYRLLRPLESVVDTTGAGDALLAGTARAYAGGRSLEQSVLAGMLCAHLTIFVNGAVAHFFDEGLLGRLWQAIQLPAGGVASSRL